MSQLMRTVSFLAVWGLLFRSAAFGSGPECPVCFEEVQEAKPAMTCIQGHKIDKECLELQFKEDKSQTNGLRCWGDRGKCTAVFSYPEVAQFLGVEVPKEVAQLRKEKDQVRSELDTLLGRDTLDLGSRLGFSNLGMTCFANSVFKLLSVHPDILSIVPTEGMGRDIDPLVQRDFSSLMRKYHSGGSVLGYDSDLHKLYDTYEEYLKKRQGGDPYISLSGGFGGSAYLRRSQADAAEFMIGFLNALGYEKFFHPFTQMSQVYYPSTEHYSLGGAEAILSLDLPIHHQSILSIPDALEHYFAPETLSDADGVENDRNGKRREGVVKKPVLIAKEGQLPKQIILTLKRFQWNEFGQAQTLRKKVQVPFEITLPYYQNTQSAQNNEKPLAMKMNLAAVINHWGSVHFGHYVAFTHHPATDTWLAHNDRQVSKVGKYGSGYGRNFDMRAFEEEGYIFLYVAQP